MEKTLPEFSEHQGDGGSRPLLMPPEPNKETFPALECPQGQEPRVAFLQDVKKPLENSALSGTTTETELEEDSFYAAEELAAMSREGKGPSGSELRPLREDPHFFSSLSRQEPDVALEAHDVADEPDPALSGAVPATAPRTELGSAADERLEFQKVLYRPDARSSLDLRNVAGSVSWDANPLETREGSTLERFSGLKEPKEVRGGKEAAFQEGNAVRVDPEEAESDSEELDGGKGAAEPPTLLGGGGGDEKYLKNEPKRLEGVGKEHLEKSKRGIPRLEWGVPRPNRSPSPHYKDVSKAADGAAALPFRGQPLREVPPPLTPSVFRKTLLGKPKPSESSSALRKGLLVDSDLGEMTPLAAAEWTIQKPSLQLGADLAVGKQSWTVNEEDSVERLPLLPLEPAPCSSYEVEMRPYVCSVLVEEQGKEELGPEEDPAVYTCIECSIYFKKKEHLMDHMLQHNRGAGRDQDGDAASGQCQFCCGECGWAFGDPAALEQHKRLHQESREKIIEEIQKLNEFPDEGREARLQCPKCVFGTNSSKIFVQHAKMHVKERKDQGVKNVNLFGSVSAGETREGPVHGVYKPFKANEAAALPGKGLSTCLICSFPAPNENILKEHMKYAHSHLGWDAEAYEEDPNQPGTSRDAYSPARPGRFAEMDYFGKAERLFPPPLRESTAQYEALPGLGLTHPRLHKSNGAGRKEHPTSGFHARKGAPYAAPHKNLGLASPKAYSHFALQQLKKKAGAQATLEGEGDGAGSQAVGLEELRHKWVLGSEVGSAEEEISISTEIDLSESRGARPVAVVPQAALELKRSFRDILKATDPAIASEEQQHQLRMMVPIVLLEEMSLHPKAKKRPRKLFKKKMLLPPPRELVMEEALPLDVLLLDAPLEGPLELEDFLDSESPMLKNEERKCPYCPDRFHNGIGLANHVRGHLNRVGVSYNVRHFISAEEVKAIEQKFSFQKKKKKVANFDPSTFSLMRCEFCGAGFDTRAGLSSHARAHLRDFGITNWELTVSPINILKELLANSSSEHPLLQAAMAGMEPSSPERDPHGFGAHKSLTPMSEGSVPRSPLSPFPAAWGDEALQPYREVLAPEEDELVAMEVGSPPLPKKSAPAVPLDPPPPARIGTKLSPEPPGSKAEPQDSKAQNLTTCEVCGACFETRKGLSSHARSHLRQLGVAESESSGAPIDLLYELMKQKVKPDGSSLPPVLGKKPPKDATGSPRPSLLALGKAGERLSEGPVNKAIKSPPGFSKSLSQPGSPLLKKVPPALSGSPSPKNPEEKSSKLSLSPLPGSPKAPWPPVDEEGPLNLTSGSEPVRDIRCEFCGEFFENRKGLSSHARSHLRQMGVTEWYVNGSPIDTLREILKRRSQPRGGTSNPAGPGKAMAKSLFGSLGSLEPRGPGDIHIPVALGKKVQPPGSPLGHSPTSSPPPTARKMFPGLSPPSLQKKLKQDHLRLEIKREMMAGGLHGEPHPSDCAWPPREEMSPLNLSSRADPVRDIRCEFCGEFFENRKGLSSHARSHLRQMGVTEWSVNGSPIDTLREILKKKTKPCVIKKEPHPSSIEPPKGLGEEGTEPKSPGKILQGMTLTPLGGRPGKPSAAALSREISLSPLPAKAQGGFLAPLATKRPLPEERLGPHGDIKHKAYIQTELAFKSKAVHDKPAHTSGEACCELCGLYFENRKALASHARAHLRQFGVTEWCVNGSPIETLSEWIRHRPQKAGAYRSYIQGGRPFAKKFRNSGHGAGARRMPLSLQAGGVAFLSKGLPAELAHGEAGKLLDGGGSGERPMITSPLSLVKMEEHQRSNINKFERRQARPLDAALPGAEDGAEFQQKLEATRQPPPRVRPVPSLVPRPPRTSLVKFVGNIYTLKCRFCEVEFQGPLSIQEEWVWHLQRHILEMNFSKADPLRSEAAPAPEPPALAEAQ